MHGKPAYFSRIAGRSQREREAAIVDTTLTVQFREILTRVFCVFLPPDWERRCVAISLCLRRDCYLIGAKFPSTEIVKPFSFNRS